MLSNQQVAESILTWAKHSLPEDMAHNYPKLEDDISVKLYTFIGAGGVYVPAHIFRNEYVDGEIQYHKLRFVGRRPSPSRAWRGVSPLAPEINASQANQLFGLGLTDQYLVHLKMTNPLAYQLKADRDDIIDRVCNCSKMIHYDDLKEMETWEDLVNYETV